MRRTRSLHYSERESGRLVLQSARVPATSGRNEVTTCEESATCAGAVGTSEIASRENGGIGFPRLRHEAQKDRG